MKATVRENCKVSVNGHSVTSLMAGQEITGELAAFCVGKGIADEVKAKEKPAPMETKPAKPKKTKPAKPSEPIADDGEE